jgi:O-succinylbenzoate synthase
VTEVPFGTDRWPTIDAVELIRVALPLVRPHVYAGGEEDERNVVLVRAIDADGTEGWGECSALSAPGYVSETTGTAWSRLRDDLAPAWLAGSRPSQASPMAHAALEMAALDIDLRHRDTSLVESLAATFGPARAQVEWCAVLGLNATVAEVDDALRAGATQVKFKVSPARDLAPVVAVRDEYPEMLLAVDANGSYPSAAAVPPLLAELDLAYVEQPLDADDLAGSAELGERLGLRIALDESIASSSGLQRAIDMGACSVVNVKGARLGGVVEVVRTFETVRSMGIDAFVGGMLETGVGRAVALALAVQAPSTMPTDVGPTSRYFAQDLVPPFSPDSSGRLCPPSGSGIGVVPDRHTLAAHRVERVLLRA